MRASICAAPSVPSAILMRCLARGLFKNASLSNVPRVALGFDQIREPPSKGSRKKS